MTEKTDLNVTPYHDDFSEDKKFHKVLFRAGRPLQARELTQSQSILQNQVERFAGHVFEEGSLVDGAQTDVVYDYGYVKVNNVNPNSSGDSSVSTYLASFKDKYIQGKTSGAVARVYLTAAETSDDPTTLIVKYLAGGTDSSNSFYFDADEELEEVSIDENGNPTSASNNNQFKVQTTDKLPVGRSSIASITEGVVYLRGFFVKVDAAQLILEKYSGQPSYRIGLDISEQLISSADDSSLLDNAQGTTNENAPGADRFKIQTTFVKKLVTATDDTNFIELYRVVNGTTELKVSSANYSNFENALARRTYDQSGDFTVRQFIPAVREHLQQNDNQGYYTTSQGGDIGKFVLQVSPGKAYVRGHEIDKIGTTPISIPKARTVASLSGTSTSARLGNYIKLGSVHSVPEFGNEGGEDTLKPNQLIKLYDSTIATPGTEPSSGQIGFARVRNFDELESVDTNSDGVLDPLSRHALYLFDIKMFTKIGITNLQNVTPINVGDRVDDQVTGAHGIVADVDYTNDFILVHDVQGSFVVGNSIKSTGTTSTTYTNGISSVRNYNIDRIRGVSQTPSNASREKFTGDVIVDAEKVLSGTVSLTAGSASVVGFGTRFQEELKEGDIIVNPIDGDEYTVSAVGTATSLTLTSNIGAGDSYQGNVSRRRVKLYDQNQTANIFAFSRDFVKSFTPDSCQVRRQTTVEVSSQAFTISSGSGNTFPAITASNVNSFVEMAVIEQASGSPTLLNGDVLDPRDFFTSLSGDSTTLSFGNLNTANNGAIIKISYTVNIGSPVQRNKTLREGKMLKVGTKSSNNGFYGTGYDDKEISLGLADVFKIRGIYEAEAGSNPLPPSATIDQLNAGIPFVDKEVIKGQTSGARAKIINYAGDDNTSYFYYLSSKRFSASESVVGETSTATGTLSNVSAGSKDIKNRYFFDDGQRDGFYDYAKIQLKPGEPAPNNAILIVFDYFTHSAGNFFDVSSYDNQISYQDIPKYVPNKVDLGGLEPDGQFELSDAVDFRPVADQLIGLSSFSTQDIDPTSASLVDISNNSTGITAAPFKYESTEFTASALDVPVTNSSIQGDITFYVPRIDKVFLHKAGNFQVNSGVPALSPTKPKVMDDAIEMFELFIPPFTANVKKIKIKSIDHRRYTMKDIGRIQNRVANLERLTTLSLLERDTQNMQIQDADGFDRYKSGFVVDSFKGHGIGDVSHPDYGVAVDTKLGTLRPQVYTSFFDLALNTNSSSSYAKTGNLLTLPFTEKTYVNQDKASRTINVNPYNVFAFIGNLTLSPNSDVWNDSERLPEVRINREGNFDAVLAENANSLGTVWNAWQTTWVGEPNAVNEEVVSSRPGAWSGDPAQGGEWVPGEEVTRVITETPETQTRNGVKTTVVEDFVEDRRDRIVSISIVPFIRSRRIELDAQNLQPNRKHYVFFDGINVNAHITPFSSAFGDGGATAKGTTVKSNRNGRLRAYFDIPNNDAQRFPTGQREVKITASESNLSNPPSYASNVYQAQGLLQSSQTEIISTKNGRVIRENLTSGRSIERSGEFFNRTAVDLTAPPLPEPPVVPPVDPPLPPDNTDPLPPPPPIVTPDPNEPIIPNEIRAIPDVWEFRGWQDPLAESFLVESRGGMFITSIDLFFNTKDESLPVTVEIRNMVNGYPGQIVLPYSEVTKNPSEINISEDGSTATTFTFNSPVYVEEGQEYCFVVLSNSNKYETFISTMGEADIKTGQLISGQPYAGSLFKSQNASTWTAEQTQDLKFHMKTAKFDTSKTSNIIFENGDLATDTLQVNPIQTTQGQSTVKVYHYTHGMYDVSSNVTISGIQGDRENGVTNIGEGSATLLSGSLPADGAYQDVQTTSSGSGTGVTLFVTVSSGAISDIKIQNCGSNYSISDTLTITNLGSSTNSIQVNIDAVDDTLGGVPVSLLNKTHSAIASPKLDSYELPIDWTTTDFDTATATVESSIGGGTAVVATRNYYFDSIHTMIPSLTLRDTRLTCNLQLCSMKSPEGFVKGTPYTMRNSSQYVTLNDNVFLDAPSIVASRINETSQASLSGARSFKTQISFITLNENVSPVVDISSMGVICNANRINGLDSLNAQTITPTQNAEGELNAMTYVTKRVNLKQPASSIRVILDGFSPLSTDIKVMYKILLNDESTPFDDVGYNFFNTNGSPNTTVEKDGKNFKEYEYSVEDLPEFSSFAIKIVGQSHNTSVVPLVSNLRAIALAT